MTKNYLEHPRFLDAIELVRRSVRQDLALKLAYARKKLANEDCQFERHAYLENIRAFNGFYESEPLKVSPENFVDSFDDLIDSIGTRGFSPEFPVEVSHDGELVGGAHRTAIAAALELSVPIRVVDHRPCWNFEYFRDRGQPDYIGDFATIEKIKVDPSTRLVLVYGGVSPRLEDQFVDSVMALGALNYRRELFLNFKEMVSLKRLLYDSAEHRSWLGNAENNFAGARRHASQSQGKWPIRAYVISGLLDESVRDLKQHLREISGLGNHAAHSTDSHEETLAIAKTVLNPNTKVVLGNLSPDLRALDFLNESVTAFSPSERDRLLIVGGTVLEVLGIRRGNDVDFLPNEVGEPITPPNGWDDHSTEGHFYTKQVSWLLEDPRSHFSLRGFKFIAPSELLRFKMNRKEFPKDWLDAANIAMLNLPASIARKVSHLLAFSLRFLDFAALRSHFMKIVDWFYVKISK